jgi:regulator of sigma E protease
MAALSNLFYFIVALGILVTIHEYGHFWVARKLGVKVLTFSVGFGKAIWQRKGKDGVKYVIAAIPLGGYVKMLDEREGEVSDQDKPYAFNRKSVWARMAIVLAGPLANFILAIVLYWWMFILGIAGYAPQMGQIDPDTIAGQAGLMENDIILQVDGEAVYLMQDVIKAAANRIGEINTLVLTVERKNAYSNKQQTKDLQLNLATWQLDDDKPDILSSLGIKHKLQNTVVKPELIEISKQSPAALSGLLLGDIVVAVNQKPIERWQDLSQLIQKSPNQETEWLIHRNGELHTISVVIGSRKVNDSVIGYLGIRANSYVAVREGGFFESLNLAVDEAKNMVLLSVNLFKKLITGDLSTKSLSGPIAIAEGAGGSARAGLVYFISFVAMISVNLGFINLLPVPLLDGGHLLYFAVEAIKGKPLSDRVQEIGLQIGMLLVFALMATAIFNDLSRLSS